MLAPIGIQVVYSSLGRTSNISCSDAMRTFGPVRGTSAGMPSSIRASPRYIEWLQVTQDMLAPNGVFAGFDQPPLDQVDPSPEDRFQCQSDSSLLDYPGSVSRQYVGPS